MKLTKEQLEVELDRLQDSTTSKIVIEFLNKKVDELDTVSGVETIKELQGRKNAIRKLKEVINRLQPSKQINNKNEYN